MAVSHLPNYNKSCRFCCVQFDLSMIGSEGKHDASHRTTGQNSLPQRNCDCFCGCVGVNSYGELLLDCGQGLFMFELVFENFHRRLRGIISRSLSALFNPPPQPLFRQREVKNDMPRLLLEVPTPERCIPSGQPENSCVSDAAVIRSG